MAGLRRIFESSKGVAAVVAVLGIVLVQALKLDLDTARTLSVSIGTLAALYIAGTAYEDAGKIRKEDK